MALGRRVVKRAISRVASPKRAASALQNLQKAIAANRVAPWHAELHPRDRFGKFRNSFKLPPVVQRTIDRMLATFKHKRFRDQKEADDYLIQQPRRARYTPEQSKIVDDFLTPEGNTRIEAALRQDADLDAKYWTPPGTDRPVEVPGHEIHTMEAMVRPTEDDLILTRTTDYAPFGLTPQNADEIEEWTGWLVRDKGFAPTKIGNPIPEAELQSRDRPPPHVTWSIVAPAGTRAIIPGDRGGADPSTVILDKDQDLRITRVVKHPGGHYVYAVATPRRGKGEAPRALGKRLSPRERAFKRQGLNPDGTPITSPAARPVPPRGTPAPGEEGLPPTTPVEAGPPLKRVKPAKAIKQAGEEVPVGAGRVTREEQPERPRIARERETARALEQERKARGRGQVSTPEEVQRAADERRAARQAEMEARREARRANLEITRLKIAEAREKRLDERQKRFDDFRDQQLIRQDSEIEQLRRRLEARELPAEGATEGGINVRAMTPSQRKDIVDRDRRLRDLGQGYPHEDNSEEMRIARAADEIRAMPPEERGAVPEGVRQARPTPPPPAGLAAGPQPGYDVKETLPNGRTRTGRVVSISEDGVTVRWRDGTQNPDLDPEDPKLAFTKPKAKRPRIRRAATTAAPAAERFPEREGVKPRAGYGISWTDENGELARGRVVKRNRNGTLVVDWEDGSHDTSVDANDPKYRFENAKEIRQREAAAAREAKKAEKGAAAEKKQRQIRFQESERRLLAQADAIKARGGPADERERRIVRIAAMLRGEEVPEKVEPPLGLTTPTRRELTPDVRARLERDNNIGREAEDIAKAGGPKTAYQRQIVRQAEDIRRAEEAFQAARRERVRAGLTPEERDLYDLSVTDLNRLASENGIEGNVGDIGRLPLIQRIRERDIVAGDLGKPRVAKAVKKAAPPAPVKKAAKAAPAVKKAAPAAKKAVPAKVAKAAPEKKATPEVSRIAALFHDEVWRSTQPDGDGALGKKPKPKTTTDKAWIKAHGTDQVDIANTKYVDLPADWQKENRDAAEVVARIIRRRGRNIDLNDEKVRQEVGEEIHQAWLSRPNNAYAKGGDLDVPFADLPRSEQDKDIDQLRIALAPSRATRPTIKKAAPAVKKAPAKAAKKVAPTPAEARAAARAEVKARDEAKAAKAAARKAAVLQRLADQDKAAAAKKAMRERGQLERRIVRQYVNGKSIKGVADEEGMSYGAVHKILTDNGIHLRPRGGARVRKTAPAPAKKAVKAVKKAAPSAKPTITREKTSAAEVAKWREQAKAAGLPSDLAGLRAEAKQRGWKGYSAWDVTTLRRRLLEGGGTAEIQQPRAARRVAKTVARKVQEPVAVERTGKEIVDSLSPTERREWDSLSLGDKADYIDRRRRNPSMKHGEALFLARGNLGPGGEAPAAAKAVKKVAKAAPERPVIKKAAPAKVAKATPVKAVKAAPVKKAAPRARAADLVDREDIKSIVDRLPEVFQEDVRRIFKREGPHDPGPRADSKAKALRFAAKVRRDSAERRYRANPDILTVWDDRVMDNAIADHYERIADIIDPRRTGPVSRKKLPDIPDPLHRRVFRALRDNGGVMGSSPIADDLRKAEQRGSNRHPDSVRHRAEELRRRADQITEDGQRRIKQFKKGSQEHKLGQAEIAEAPKLRQAAGVFDQYADELEAKQPARAAKKAVKAVKPTVTRAPTKVENADDVIRNSATILRQPEHPGWDIIQHKGNKRWYIIDPKGNLHRDGRVTSSLTMEGAQKRLARIPQPTPAQRGAQKVKAEAADLRQAAKGLRRKGETDRAENLEKAAGVLDKRAAELVPERKPRVTRAAKKAAPAEEVVPRGYERRLFNGNPVLVRKGEPEIGPGDSVDFRTGRVMKAGSPELRARISKGLAEQAERAGWGNDVQGFVRSGGVVKKAAPAKKTARATVLARIARLPEAQRTEVQALQRPEQAAYFDARDRKVPHARALADALSQIQKPGRLRAKKAVPEAEIQQPRAARVAERPVIKKAGAVVPTPSQRKVLEALDRGERKFARADVGKRLQDNGWLEYKDGVPRLTDAGRAAIGKKAVARPTIKKATPTSTEGRVRPNGRIPLGALRPGDRIHVDTSRGNHSALPTTRKTGVSTITVDRIEQVAQERGFQRTTKRFQVIGHDADGTEIIVPGAGAGRGWPGHQTFLAAPEAPPGKKAVKKAAPERPVIKRAPKKAVPEAPAPVKKAVKRAPVGTSGTSETKPETLTALRKRAGTAGVRGASRMQRPELETALARHEAGDTSVAKPERPTITRAPRAGMTVRQAQTQSAVDVANKYQHVMPEEHDGVRQKVVQGLASGDLTPTAARSILRRESERLLREARESRAKGDHNKANAASKAHVYYDLMQDDMVIKKLTPAVEKYRSGGGPTVTPLPARPQRAVPSVPTKTAPVKKAAAVVEAPAPARTVRKQIVPDLVRGDLEKARDAREMGEILDDLHLGNNKEAWRNLARDVGVKPPRLRDRRSPAQIRKQIIDTYDEERKHLDEILPVHVPGPEGKVRRLMAPAATKPRAKSAWARKRDLPENAYNPNSGHRPRQVLDDADAIYMASDRDDAHRFVDSLDNVRFNNLLREMDIPREEKTRDELTDSLLTKVREKEPKAKSIQKSATELRHERTFQFKDLMERHDLEHGIRTVAGRNALRHGLAQYTESGDKESVIEALRREADELETRDLSGNNILGQAAGLSPDQRRQIAKADADQIRRFADSFERQGIISLGGPRARPHVTRQAPKVRGPKAKRPAETTAQAIERMTRIGPLSESEEDLPEFEKAFRAVKAAAPAKKAVAAAVPERPTITRETPRRPVSGPGGTIKALPEAGREKLLTRLRKADSPEAVEKILEDEQVNGSDLQEIMHDIGIGDRATLRIPERRKAIAQQLKGEIQQPVGRPRLRAAQRADLEALSPAERADYEANIDRGLPHDRALAEALAQIQKPGRQRAVKKAVPGRPKITRAARKALPVVDRVEALRRAEAAGKAPEVVPFYGKESPFSQHHPAPFEIDGVRYPTAEHYMMAEKARMFGDDETLAKILATPSPVEAKRLGRKVKGFDADRWDAVSADVARRGNMAKFEQNPALRDALLATGDKVLAEASPRDARWGIGRGRGDADLPSKWRGENRLGFVLMDVRDSLKGRRTRKAAVKKAAAPVKKAAAPERRAGGRRGIPGGGNLPGDLDAGGPNGIPSGPQAPSSGGKAKETERAPAAKKAAAKKAAPAEKEEKFLRPLANGTKRKSATNLRVGDVTTGPSGQWGTPHTITGWERIPNDPYHQIRLTRDDGKTYNVMPNNAFWMGEEPAKKAAAPAVAKKVVPKAVRPTIIRAAKVTPPTAKPIERMTREELHAEIDRRNRAGEDLGATQHDFTRDELRRVLAGERVELRGAQRRAAAKARGAERAAAPRKTPVRESLSTHEAAQRIKAAKTHQEVVEATQLVRNRDSLNNLLVDLGMPGSSDRSRPLSAIRQQIIEGWSPEENPEIRRAKPKPLRKVAAKAERPTIKREAPTKKVAEAPRSTTPAIDEDVPLLGDPEGDNSIMHGDSGSMELAQEYARRGRNGTANKLMQLRHDISETRHGRDNGDLDGPQKLVDELKDMLNRESDLGMVRQLAEAIREMDFPRGPDPDLPEGTPPAARQLLHDLSRIPVARAPKGSHLHGMTTDEDSPVDRLAQIFREVAGSKGEVSVGDIERRIERVLGTYHESVDGSYRMQSLWHRLDRDSSLSKELKEWVGRLREPGPLMGNKKLGPNTRGMLSERRDLTPGTPAIKKPKQLTKPEIKKLTDGQVVSAFEANKISRADAAAELRSRALDLDTAAGHLELREHHIGHPEALEMRRVADKNRDLANQIETGTLLRTGEKPTAQVAAERKALREATRAKAKRIATAQGRASYARDLEQLLEATSQDGDDNRLRTLIGDRFRSAAPGNHDEALGWDTTRAAIGEMLPNETRQQFQERMRDVLRNHGIEVNGNSGDWLDYDPDNHQLLAGTTKAGNAVQTLIPGISYRDEDGSLIELSKPLVRTKADALKEGIVPDRVTLGRRGTGRLEKGTLTGEMSRTDRAHDLLTEDTKPEGVPVRDLTLGNGYKISEGRAVRRDGITYIAEHDPADAKAVSSRIRRMQELHDRIPAEGRQFQRSYVIANGHNPDDAQVSKRIGHDMEARATAGGGQLHIWQAGKKDFGGDSLEATVLHETGHNIAHGVRDRKLGATHGRYGRWNLDAAADGNPQEQGRIFGFKPRDNHIARRVAPILSSRYPKGTGRFRHGSTTYGEKDVGEDFADSHALYAMGPIGEGKLTPNGPTEPIYFRDLWPHKAAHLDEIYPEFGARQVEEIAARRGGRAPVTGPLTQISAPNIPPKLRSSGRGRKAVTVVRRPRAAQIQEPRQARAMGRGIEEGEAVWPEPNPSLITRRPDGTFTGRLNSNEGMARMLPRDTGPEGVPVRSLTLPNGYQMPIATAWRHDGVTYVIQHRDNDVSRARAKAVKERLREFHSSLPAEAQRWQRSYAFALDPSPQDSVYKQRYNDPNFASSASAGGGNLTIWDSGTHLHLERGDALFYDDLRHEVGHNAGKATGAVPAFDRPSPRVSEIVRTSDPRGRVRDFVPLPRDSSRTLFAAVKNWGRFKPPPGVKIMVPNGVTPYGRMSHGENFAEAHMLYLMGIVGYGKLGNSNRSEPIYFRDLFPEWAALFDEMYPGFAQRQLAIIADERLPQRPRITRAPRRIQASAVRGSHTLQYHLALPERS